MRGIVARRAGVVGSLWLGALLLLARALSGADAGPGAVAATAPFDYAKTPAQDPIAVLQKKIDAGQATLAFDDRHGYLEAVLKAVNIPASSQMLVFSKTSFQREAIAPWQPRALYFNDDVYVGWVQGGQVLEVASVDKHLGAVFYTLDQEDAGGKPRFRRQGMNCLQCHEGSMTQNIPGLVVRSVFTDSSGAPLLTASNYLTTPASPFAQRWGGWYVSGTAGSLRHMGNLLLHAGESPEAADLEKGANLDDLSGKFSTGRYLSPGSDIVALLVLAHQTQVHNLVTRATYQVRALGVDAADREKRLAEACEPLVRALLFCDEAVLPGPVKGTSNFAADFAKAGAPGTRDTSGRSLRDLDLQTRLFKYPCSYLIYTESFGALPQAAKDYVYRRLWEVVSGGETGKAFAHLSVADRRAVREILRETVPELPGYWRE